MRVVTATENNDRTFRVTITQTTERDVSIGHFTHHETGKSTIEIPRASIDITAYSDTDCDKTIMSLVVKED